MGKKKSSVKNLVPASKQGLDDFLSTWSDDEPEDDDPKPVLNGHTKTTNGQKQLNGHKSDSDESIDEEELDEEESGDGEEESGDGEEESGDGEEESGDGEEESGDGEEESGDGEEESGDGEEESGDEDGSDSEEEGAIGASQQKRYLSSLKDKDPEFFEFLKENDSELLNFDDSSSEEEDEEDGVETLHKPPQSLEVASDESDFEMDGSDDESKPSSKKKSNSITKALMTKWSESLAKQPTPAILLEVVLAFRSAVSTIGSSDTEPTTKDPKTGKAAGPPPKVVKGKYIVEGSAAFNGVVRLCLTSLVPAFNKFLGLAEGTRKANQPQRSKSWAKLKKHLKIYSADLVKLMTSLSTGSVLAALLKHVQNMVPYFAAIPKSSKSLTKCMVHFWSTGNEESVRVLAFMSLLRMTRISLDKKSGEGEDDDQTTLFETVLKQMYMAYVRNSKFTSPTAWPMIHFMRRSLAEIFNLNHQVAYRYAFIYIRQLAIQLRNAMMQQKGKETLESVYNWQFVHCTHLWTQLLTETHPSDVLEPLVNPLVQVISGAIRLGYTPKFYPLRFHLCQQLTKISSETQKFIPVLPYYLDVLNNYNFNKKSQKLSMKPLDFGCCLKVSKSQLIENGFKDTTMEQVYCGIFAYLHAVSHKISFPELVVPLTFQLKSFLKSCHVANYSKKLKQVLDKTIENGKFVMERRKKVTFGVRDLDQIQAWELGLKTEGTPVSKFYESFRKVKEQETRKEISQNDNLDDYNFVPKLKPKKKGAKQEKEFKGLLGSSDDESEDDDDDERFMLKEERAGAKNKRKLEEETSDKKVKKSKQAPNEEPKAKQLKPSTSKGVKKPVESSDEDEGDEVGDLELSDMESGDEGQDDADSSDHAEESGDDDDDEDDDDEDVESDES